ncbi:hypothetical protein FOTG_17801 [Fusarium oxysporum f. sp. vasinfectum 25433]|uniref:Uncharacterized protein n=1 Tax=Fusarium oxysporum f. sp. vasinfectum 25433 TaxID=1089449 RepID=X0KYA8_FUSOX|nr:hypothetical protein FOTG_17801 [Fusarium oxysporum f. sp. vasinfectum 25433]
MARKLEAAEARDTAYGEQNILFAHQPYSSGRPHLEVLRAFSQDIQLDIPTSKRQMIPPNTAYGRRGEQRYSG